MRRRDEIDLTTVPPRPTQSFHELPATRERTAVIYAEGWELVEPQRELLMYAKCTPDALRFTQRSIDAAEAAVDAYNRGAATFEIELDEQTQKVTKKLFGVVPYQGASQRIEDAWRYFRVRVLVNGYIAGNVDARPPTAHRGYVLVFDMTAPWLRDEIETLMDEAGYERTVYVARLGYSYQPMRHMLAYALPTASE